MAARKNKIEKAPTKLPLLLLPINLTIITMIGLEGMTDSIPMNAIVAAQLRGGRRPRPLPHWGAGPLSGQLGQLVVGVAPWTVVLQDSHTLWPRGEELRETSPVTVGITYAIRPRTVMWLEEGELEPPTTVCRGVNRPYPGLN